MDQIRKYLTERIDAGDFPSAVYLVADKGKIVLQDALGLAVVEPERVEARLDTIYDLASLTKVLVTGLLTAIYIERGEISVHHRVAGLLGEFNVDGKSTITVRQLMSHTSLLPAWKPFYLLTSDPHKILAEIAKLKVDPGQNAVTYSDPGFIASGVLLERLAGKSLDQIAKDEIFTPLNLTDTSFNPPSTLRPRIAASEFGNLYEKQTCIDLGYDLTVQERRDYRWWEEQGLTIPIYGWRDHQIWGEVHDGTAWFMGGVAGHAGLFSTAEEIFKIARQFLPKYTTLLKPETCELFRTDLTVGMNEDRSLAFQLATTPDSTAGGNMSAESFGHNGFTGTSLWIDPVKERIFILLTNRTHHHDLPFVNINSVRRKFHDLAIEVLDKN